MSNFETPPKHVSTAGTLFGRIFGQVLHVEDIPTSETTPEMAYWREKVVLVGNTFTTYVDLIRRSKFLGERVQGVGRLLWGLVGNRIVPGTVAPTLTGTISFFGERKAEREFATIVIPPDWLQQIQEDPIMQFGGVVCVAGQARDFYNRKLDPHTVNRGLALEAEALTGIRQVDADWRPNDYQSEILRRYPEGTKSLPEGVWYESKAFVDPRPGEDL
jgi:hypothetical protein